MENRHVTFLEIRKDSIQYGQYDIRQVWRIILVEKCQQAIDLLYDIIKADLVEKVEGSK